MATYCYSSSMQKLRAKAFKYVSDALVYDARSSGTVLRLKIYNCKGEIMNTIAKRSSLCTVQIANHSDLCNKTCRHGLIFIPVKLKVIANRLNFCTLWLKSCKKTSQVAQTFQSQVARCIQRLGR